MNESSNDAQHIEPTSAEIVVLTTICRDAARRALEGGANTLVELCDAVAPTDAWSGAIESFAFAVGSEAESTALSALDWLRTWNFEHAPGADAEFTDLVHLFRAALAGGATPTRVRAYRDWLDTPYEQRPSTGPAELLVAAAWDVAKRCLAVEIVEGPESSPWW